MKKNFHKEFYSFAKYYDIAFDFKDVGKECDFMEQIYHKHTQQKALNHEVQLQYDCADMIHYQSLQIYDIAAILMDSTSYLLTNEDVITHFRSVASILNPKGLYILEMSHPRSVFNITTSTVNTWEMKKDGVTVKTQWGSPNDEFDPITQITSVSTQFEYEDDHKKGIIESISAQRSFTAT